MLADRTGDGVHMVETLFKFRRGRVSILGKRKLDLRICGDVLLGGLICT